MDLREAAVSRKLPSASSHPDASRVERPCQFDPVTGRDGSSGSRRDSGEPGSDRRRTRYRPCRDPSAIVGRDIAVAPRQRGDRVPLGPTSAGLFDLRTVKRAPRGCVAKQRPIGCCPSARTHHWTQDSHQFHSSRSPKKRAQTRSGVDPCNSPGPSSRKTAATSPATSRSVVRQEMSGRLESERDGLHRASLALESIPAKPGEGRPPVLSIPVSVLHWPTDLESNVRFAFGRSASHAERGGSGNGTDGSMYIAESVGSNSAGQVAERNKQRGVRSHGRSPSAKPADREGQRERQDAGRLHPRALAAAEQLGRVGRSCSRRTAMRA